MSAAETIGALRAFHEWRQDAGLAGATWDSAISAYAEVLEAEERTDVVNEIRDLLRTSGVSPSSHAERIEQLLDRLAL